MISRVLSTPIARARPDIPAAAPRRVSADVLAAVLPGPGRDRLAAGEALVVTTGQQPGLFTGPLYTIHKALSAIALARRLERERGVPVVPVIWVAGDDHDFAEANHAWMLTAAGTPARIVLRERPQAAPQLPLFREPCGPAARLALDALATALPDTEYKSDTLAWLTAAYRPDANLADAAAAALHALLASRGLAVFRAYDARAKRAALPWIMPALDITLADGLSPVLVEAAAGRDRLRPDGGEAHVTRRSGERLRRADIERIAADAPERLSPNVLLRPVIEAALFPTVAYLAGPAELEYLPQAQPLFARLGVPAQAAVPRWSGVILESRVDRVLQRHALTVQDFDGHPDALEGRLVRETLPPEVVAELAGIRGEAQRRYEALRSAVAGIDPTLERTVESARNAVLHGAQQIEKKLIASLKRSNETLLGQLARARGAIAPGGKPQERVLTVASFLARHGPGLLDELAAEVARWAAAP